ncbi:MAG: NifU family protein [Clostridiales bacterium]|jgi:Fe-S cluster biogenesis protein NfuA|nr:NifU family protein [Clostridiales bacterium]MDR2752506.1 NifU family protein [Clostridiales bacterium]
MNDSVQNNSIQSQAKRALSEQINPILKLHNGFAELAGIQEDVILLRMRGACSSCADISGTLDEVIVPLMLKAVPEAKGVEVLGNVSPELFDFGKKLMGRGIG